MSVVYMGTCGRCGRTFSGSTNPSLCLTCKRDRQLGRVIPPLTPAQTKAAARIQSALQRIEHAQRELHDAMADISSVRGLVREWERLGKVADRVKAEWHKLHNKTAGKTFEVDQ